MKWPMTKSIVLWTLLIAAVSAMVWALCSQIRKQFDPFKHQVRQLSFWKKYKFNELALEDRLFEIPYGLLDHLTKDNIGQGWPNRPVKVTLSPENQLILKEALRELPESIKDKATPLLAGIFFVKDLGGTAYSEYIIDEYGNPVAGFMVFDELILSKKANKWATWKEKSPFKLEGSDWDLRMTIEDSANDNIKSAFQFIALHELGHIVSINSRMHPPWGYPVSSDKHPSKFEFSKLSWTLDGDKTVSLFENVFPLRSQVYFYKGESEADLIDVYSQLEKTNFPTLYSSTNLTDDFADSFAAFVHVVLLKRPYQVVVLKDGRPIKIFGSCWKQSRCLGKEIILRKFLNFK